MIVNVVGDCCIYMYLMCVCCVQVMELDEEKERFLLTLRCSDLRLSLTIPAEEVGERVVRQFEHFLEEREHVLQQLSLPGI